MLMLLLLRYAIQIHRAGDVQQDRNGGRVGGRGQDRGGHGGVEQEKATVEEHGLAQLHGHQVADVWMQLLLFLMLLRHQLQSPQ